MSRMPPMKTANGEGDRWKTPQGLFEVLNKEFHFDFDPCPAYPPKFDGLALEWGRSNFVNPPYSGTNISKWLNKGIEQSKLGKTCVFLLPSRTGTQWFHEFVLPCATEIRFVRGRIAFGKWNAPFDSIIVIFK
jgi:site-specific DNA-methyltransferase (adenine-specific)